MDVARRGSLKSTRPATWRGFTLIELLVVMAIIGVLVALLLNAVQSARESARRVQCVNHMRQVGIGLIHFESARRHFPAGAISRKLPGDPTTPHSFFRWSALAQVLPYLENTALYQSIDMNQPLYGRDFQVVPRNRPAVAQTIAEYLCPSDQEAQVNRLFGPTNYALCTGTGIDGGTPFDTDGVFFVNSDMRARSIKDGLSKTMALSESTLGMQIASETPRDEGDPRFVYVFAKASPLTEASCNESAFWNYDNPRGFSWANGEYRSALYNHHAPPNTRQFDCISARVTGPPSILYAAFGWRAARSRHGGGVNGLLLDGSVQFLTDDIDPQRWYALATRHGDAGSP